MKNRELELQGSTPEESRQPARSFAQAFVKRGGKLVCRKCDSPAEALPHVCGGAR